MPKKEKKAKEQAKKAPAKVKAVSKQAPEKAKKTKDIVEEQKASEIKVEKKDKDVINPSEIPFHREPIILKSKRKYFSHQIDQKVEIPNLIEIQLNSYEWFLNEGIRELLEEITPIQDFSGKKLELHFLEHSVAEAKYNAETAKNKNLTYEAALKVHVQLINKETGEIKEQDVF
jgi:DNA-directed RNA polymerase beta subunit